MATLLQVQYINDDTIQNVAIPNGVWTDIPGLAVTITPTSATSVIEISANIAVAETNINRGYIRFSRNGVGIGVGTGGLGVPAYARYNNQYFASYLYVDSPASTLALTYQLQFYSTGGNTERFNSDNTNSYSGVTTIVCREIG